jgi:hypothetical protein
MTPAMCAIEMGPLICEESARYNRGNQMTIDRARRSSDPRQAAQRQQQSLQNLVSRNHLSLTPKNSSLCASTGTFLNTSAERHAKQQQLGHDVGESMTPPARPCCRAGDDYGSFHCGRRAKKTSASHRRRRTPARDTYAAWRIPGTPMRVLPRAVV